MFGGVVSQHFDKGGTHYALLVHGAVEESALNFDEETVSVFMHRSDSD